MIKLPRQVAQNALGLLGRSTFLTPAYNDGSSRSMMLRRRPTCRRKAQLRLQAPGEGFPDARPRSSGRAAPARRFKRAIRSWSKFRTCRFPAIRHPLRSLAAMISNRLGDSQGAPDLIGNLHRRPIGPASKIPSLTRHHVCKRWLPVRRLSGA